MCETAIWAHIKSWSGKVFMISSIETFFGFPYFYFCLNFNKNILNGAARFLFFICRSRLSKKNWMSWRVAVNVKHRISFCGVLHAGHEDDSSEEMNELCLNEELKKLFSILAPYLFFEFTRQFVVISVRESEFL